jgi:uncharacterized protein YegL
MLFNDLQVKLSKRQALTPVIDRARRFGEAEDGNLTIFSITLFMLMMMIGGVAIDMMRFENNRVMLQNTLDRSTLAAAAMSQKLTPTSVVQDYFLKAGLSSFLTNVTVTNGLSFRNVKAKAEAITETPFLGTVGVNSLSATGWSEAEQRINNIEISLVLDVSGSMASNGKITNLKNAAKEFVDTVLLTDTEKKISIAIVPFNGQVNMTQTFRSKFNATNNPNVANMNCFDLPASAYTTLEMSTSAPMSMTANADTLSSTSTAVGFLSPTNSQALQDPSNVWCMPSTKNVIVPPTNVVSDLKNAIDNFQATGATSINAGMKWGTSLLDSSMKSLFTSMIGQGQMPPELASRPAFYADTDSMKVVILMTDGEHWAEERVPEAYKSGNSPIYRSNGDGNVSVRHTTGRPATTGANEYFVPHKNQWLAAPWNSGGGVTQQTWPQIWKRHRTTFVAWQYYAMALGTTNSSRNSQYNNAMALFRIQTPTSTMDTQLQSLCSQARAEGVVIYTIAFEAPANGQTQLQACASAPAYYFDAQGLQISTAFRAIASNISQLRLK